MSRRELAFAILTVMFAVLTFATMDAAEHAPADETLTEEEQEWVEEGQELSINDVDQLLDLVEKHKQDECLARAICELNHDPISHGELGVKFFMYLLWLKRSSRLRYKYYIDAMKAGAKVKTAPECHSLYPTCTHSTKAIIKVGAKILGVN